MYQIKTILLLATLSGILIAFGYLIGGFGGAILFFGFSLVMNIASYWFSDKIALSMSGAKPVSREEAKQLYADVDELSEKMNIPTPQLYIINQEQPNAFATGRNPQNSAVALTRGLLANLERDEVKAVVAHELGHIRNRDVLVSTIAAVIAGAISSLANIAFFFGGTDDEDANPLVLLATVILAPLTATLVQLAISRTREFKADATAATYTKQPQSLANALSKIEDLAQRSPMQVNPALSSLYIQNPIKGGAIASLFSTHPSTAARIEKLQTMQG